MAVTFPYRSPWFRWVLRLAGTTVLIGWLLHRMDWSTLTAVWGAGRPAWLIAAFATHFVGMGLSLLRWQILLRPLAFRLPWQALLWALMKGAFYNSFLPTSVGGDVVRIHQVARWTRRLGVVATTVFVERWLGMVAMVTWLGLGVLMAARTIPPQVFFFSLGLVLMPFVGFLALQVLGRVARGHARIAWIYRKVSNVHEALLTYHRCRGAVLHGLFWSFWIQLDVIFYFWLIAIAFQVTVSPMAFLFLVPLAQIATFIPVSLWGMGVREAVFVHFAADFGMAPEQAFLVSLTGSVLGVVFNMLGLPTALGTYGVSTEPQASEPRA